MGGSLIARGRVSCAGPHVGRRGWGDLSPNVEKGAGPFFRAIAVVALCVVQTQADVRPTPAWEWITDAPVQAAVSVDAVTYLGGAFRYVGVATPEGESFVDRASGELGTGCARRTGPADGERPIVTADPTGGLFMQVPVSPERLLDDAGTFDLPSGRSFARIGADCRFDRTFLLDTFVPADAFTRGASITRAGDRVYVGGSRPVGFGDRYGRVAAFDPATGARVGEWDYPQFDRVIVEGATPAGLLVVSAPGRGDPSGAMPVGVLNPATGAFVTLATATTTGYVRVVGAALYVSTAPGQPLLAFDLGTGAPRPGWGQPALAVTDLEVADGRVFVAGAGLGRAGVFALSESTGALVDTFTPDVRTLDGSIADVQRLAVVGSRLFVRGRGVRRAGTSERYLLAAVSTDTGAADPWAPLVFAPTADAVDLVPAGDWLYVGRVSSQALERRVHLAAVNTVTGALLAFDPGGTITQPLLPPVTALAITTQHLYAASERGDVRRVSLATAQPDGWRVTTSAGAGAPATIGALATTEATLFVGGFFTTATTSAQPGPVARSHALAVDLASATITAWSPAVVSAGSTAEGDLPVAAMARVGTTVLLGGRFSAIGAEDRSGLAAVDATSGAPVLPTVTLPADHIVTDLAQDGDGAFFVGRTRDTGEGSVPLIGRADVSGATATLWAVPAEQAPSSRVATFVGRVYSGPEWDPVSAAPTSSSLRWRHPSASEAGLLELQGLLDGENGPLRVRIFPEAAGVSPRAPRNLTVQYADTTAYLAWSPPLLGEVSSYVVRAGPTSGQSTLANFDTGSTATTLTATAPEGLYYVRIHASGPEGVSPPSNEVAFVLTPNGCNLPPREPGTLTATGTATAATLAWGAAVGATSYVVEAGSQPGASDRASQNIGRRLDLFTPAPPGTYYVRVVGVNACGRGPASNEVIVHVGAPPPGVPLDLRVTVAGGRASLAWDPPAEGGPVTYYRLEAGSAPGLSNVAVTTTTAPFFLTPIAPSGTYYVRVRAGSPSGLGPATADALVLIP